MSLSPAKLENPVRVEELRPEVTLQTIGINKSSVLCDIGAGSGVFTLPAAKLTDNTVYAIDVNNEFLQLINERAKQESLNNIKTVLVDNFAYPIEKETVDIALMVTVFHEIEDKQLLLAEIKRILRKDGTLCIVEFHKEEGPFGPPMEHRISAEEVLAETAQAGFALKSQFLMGPNFYCVLFSV